MKRIIALILCLILAVSLISCGADNGEDTGTESAADTQNAAPSGIDPSKVVMKIGDEEITFAEFNLYYCRTVMNVISYAQNSFGDQYAEMLKQTEGFDPNAPFRDQDCKYAEGSSWFEYFVDSVDKELREILTLCNLAYENGIELDENELAECEKQVTDIINYANQNQMSISQLYGDSLGISNEETVRTLTKKIALAQKAKTPFEETHPVSDEDIAAEYEANGKKYEVLDYMAFTMQANQTTVTNEDLRRYADELAATTTPEDFAAYVDNFYNNVLNSDIEDTTEYTVDSLLTKNFQYNELPAVEWLFTEAEVGQCREEFSNMGEDQDLVCTVYMLVKAPSLNDYTSKTVRHILFDISKYENSDVKCRAEADKIYNEYLKDPTEEHFAELANKYSDDVEYEYDENGNATAQKEEKTEGGIYRNIQRDQMVKEFEDWCFDEARKPGDTGIIKTQYGYHIMYFVGDGEAVTKGTDSIKATLFRKAFDEYMESLNPEYDSDYINENLP